MAASFVGNPLPYDVLCSKNKTDANHPGNAEYKRLINQYALVYDQATSKQEKTKITSEIARELMETFESRFLKFNVGNGEWDILTVANARDKISHALRTRALHLQPAGAKRPPHQRSLSPSSVSVTSLKRPHTEEEEDVEQNAGRKRRTVSMDESIPPQVEVPVQELVHDDNDDSQLILTSLLFDDDFLSPEIDPLFEPSRLIDTADGLDFDQHEIDFLLAL